MDGAVSCEGWWDPPRHSSKAGAVRVRQYVRWVNTLGAVPQIGSPFEALRRPAVVARVVEAALGVRLRRAGAAGSDADAELVKSAILALWRRGGGPPGVSSGRSGYTVADMANGRVPAICGFLHGLFRVAVLSRVMDCLGEMVQWFDGVLQGYRKTMAAANRALAGGANAAEALSAVSEDLYDCSALICCCHFHSDPGCLVDLSTAYWSPGRSNLGQLAANAGFLFSLLEASGMEPQYAPSDYTHHPHPEFVTYQAYLVWLKLSCHPRLPSVDVASLNFVDQDRLLDAEDAQIDEPGQPMSPVTPAQRFPSPRSARRSSPPPSPRLPQSPRSHLVRTPGLAEHTSPQRTPDPALKPVSPRVTPASPLPLCTPPRPLPTLPNGPEVLGNILTASGRALLERGQLTERTRELVAAAVSRRGGDASPAVRSAPPSRTASGGRQGWRPAEGWRGVRSKPVDEAAKRRAELMREAKERYAKPPGAVQRVPRRTRSCGAAGRPSPAPVGSHPAARDARRRCALADRRADSARGWVHPPGRSSPPRPPVEEQEERWAEDAGSEGAPAAPPDAAPPFRGSTPQEVLLALDVAAVRSRLAAQTPIRFGAPDDGVWAGGSSCFIPPARRDPHSALMSPPDPGYDTGEPPMPEYIVIHSPAPLPVPVPGAERKRSAARESSPMPGIDEWPPPPPPLPAEQPWPPPPPPPPATTADGAAEGRWPFRAAPPPPPAP